MSRLLQFYVGLLTIHLVNGLVAQTRNANAPKLFTKRADLPALNKVPSAVGDADTDVYSKPLPVVYTNDLTSAEEWISEHLNSSSSTNPLMLGWDMESTPNLPWLSHLYTQESYFGPATLQLSTPESALVLQIAQDGMGPLHDGGLPRFLHQLLEDPAVIPVGVGIDDDFVELYRWCLEHGDDCAGPAWASRSAPVLTRLDMGGIGLDESKAGAQTIGLARLVAGVLGVVLPKSKKLAQTHWSRKGKGPIPLTRNEVAYAARDAWAGAAILERLGGLDAERFGPSRVLQRLQAQIEDSEKPLRSIQLISNRQLLRKAVKDEWKELRNPLDDDGNEKPPWTEAQRNRYNELTEEMKQLAPTPPTRYEITNSLGLEIP